MTMTIASLNQYLVRLQLRYFIDNQAELAAQAAKEVWSYERFLEQLVAGEVARRDQGLVERRLQSAHLPSIKTLSDFDWNWPKNINRVQIQHLFRLDFVAKQHNVILLGAVGVGKTHLAIALAHTACQRGEKVLFIRAQEMVNALTAAQVSGETKRVMAQFLKPTLLVIDELGYQQVDKVGADALFRVISQRYERGSTVITSNLAFKQWATVFNNDSTLTSALLDRLLHHAETVVIEGSSYRMREPTDG